MKKEVIRHKSKKKFWPRAVIAGDRIYIAASAINDEGKAVGPGFEEQLDYTFKEIKETLEDLGSSMDNIVEMTMYYVNMERDMEKVGPIWVKYIKSSPMVAGIGTSGLMPMDPPLLIEVTCSAIISD